MELTKFPTLRHMEPIVDREGMPNMAIGRLMARNAQGNRWQGTAFLIAPGIVLTAAHCLNNAASGSVAFAYDKDDSSSASRTVAIARACIPTKYTRGDASWDVGVALLASGYDPRWTFDLAGQGSDRERAHMGVSHKQTQIWLTGYPGAEDPVTPSEFDKIDIGHMYGEAGLLTDYDASQRKLQYAFDHRGGQSGAPIFAPGYRCQVVGVHTRWAVDSSAREVGQGVILTDDVRGWIGSAIQYMKTSATDFLSNG